MMTARRPIGHGLSTGKHAQPTGNTRLRWQNARMSSGAPAPRFLQLADVAEILNTSTAQVYALVRRGELPAIKIGGRGQWRVETSELEAFIERSYEQTRSFVRDHPFAEAEQEDDARL